MARELSEVRLELQYHRAAQEYARRLPPEHYMEATAQATQRKITLESFDLLAEPRPDVHLFNELLVQYPLPRRKRPGQVVPDNMVVLYAGKLTAQTSYDVPLQPARPFMMLEYVSKNNARKDYDDNMVKYERELQVPYYLLFHPDAQELTLYHREAERYVSVKPNADGRYAIPELELEAGLLDDWTRYWFRGTLLPLPADLLRDLQKSERKLRATEKNLQQSEQRLQVAEAKLLATHQALDAEKQARLADQQELARLRAELEQRRKP